MPEHATQNMPRKPEGLRIGQLAERAGVSREMIKYYLRAGLLPQPDKPRPNLSLYSEQHAALIGLILRFQQLTRLSLPEIAAVFQNANHDPGAIELELLSDKFSAPATGTILPFDDGAAETANLTLPAAFLDDLAAEGLVERAAALTDDERRSAGLLWAAHQAGVPLPFFTQARSHILALADLEVKTMLDIQRPDLRFEEVIRSITDVDKVINRWLIGEKTSHARATFSRILENAEQALSTVHDAIYQPSRIFRERHDIDAALAALRAQALLPAATAPTLEQACRAAVLLGEFGLAVELADHALSRAPGATLLLALKCLALGMNRNLDEALACVGPLADSGSRHPLVLEARLLAMLLQAARLSGVSDASQLLKEAAELFREPIAFDPQSKADAFEACLLDARAKTLFPDAFAWREDITSKVEEMLKDLLDTPAAELQLPIDAVRHVFHIYGAYYLGQLYTETGDTVRAQQHFETVIRIDPASNLGEKAYLQMT